MIPRPSSTFAYVVEPTRTEISCSIDNRRSFPPFSRHPSCQGISGNVCKYNTKYCVLASEGLWCVNLSSILSLPTLIIYDESQPRIAQASAYTKPRNHPLTLCLQNHLESSTLPHRIQVTRARLWRLQTTWNCNNSSKSLSYPPSSSSPPPIPIPTTVGQRPNRKSPRL